MPSDLFWLPTPAPIDGVVGDVNTMRIDPSHLGMAQDVVIDQSGVLRSRGGFQSVTSDTFTTIVPHTLILTSAGTLLLGKLSSGETMAQGSPNAVMTGFVTLTAAQFVAGTTAQNILQSSAAIPTSAKLSDNLGAIISFDAGFISLIAPYTCLWGGNIATTSDTTAGTAASTIGTKAVAGAGTSWTSALEGCYLFIGAGAAAIYVGQVDQVTSTTALILKKGALKTIAAAAPAFKTIRPTQHLVYKGRITTNAASAVVVGSNTKFISSGPGGSGSVYLTNTTSNLFRYSDGAFIGAITSVQNDTTLTLTANAAIACVNEEYYISNPQFAVQSGTPGPTFYFGASGVAKFSDRFWHGGFQAADPSVKATNTALPLIVQGQNSLAFSKKNDPECLDLDPSAGDILTLPTTHNQDRIRALCSTRGGLVVFRTRDVFLITGYSPETFRAIKIADDGCSMGLGVKEYNEGVIWAGAKSVWYFDGTKIVDLLSNKIKRFYQRLLRPVDANSPLSIAISNDHVVVSYPASTQTGADRTWPVKNGTGLISAITFTVNLLTGAVCFFTNLMVTGSAYSDTLGTSVILARGGTSLFNTTGYLVSGARVFSDSSASADNFDALTMITSISSAGTIGPSVMFETVKMAAGDATRLKFWKRLLMNYSSDVSMTCATITNNNSTVDFPNISTGTASTDVFAISSNVGILKRVRFIIRTPALIIRVYQTNSVSASSQRFKLFWYAVGGKVMRQGRPQ